MKTAIVTGSSSGIGREISRTLLGMGFKVYGISKTICEFNDPNFVWIGADLTDSDEFKRISKIISEDVIDVIINDAGIAFELDSLSFSEDDFKKIFDINFKAPILLTQEFKSKIRGGTIINISSVSDRLVGEGYALYCSSKAALNIYFDVVALEEKNVNFISILPSYVDTPLLHKLQEGNKDFDWNATIKSQEIAEFIKEIINHKKEALNGARIIIVSEALKEDFEYIENLWGYNVTTKELTKLK